MDPADHNTLKSQGGGDCHGSNQLPAVGGLWEHLIPQSSVVLRSGPWAPSPLVMPLPMEEEAPRAQEVCPRPAFQAMLWLRGLQNSLPEWPEAFMNARTRF